MGGEGTLTLRRAGNALLTAPFHLYKKNIKAELICGCYYTDRMSSCKELSALYETGRHNENSSPITPPPSTHIITQKNRRGKNHPSCVRSFIHQDRFSNQRQADMNIRRAPLEQAKGPFSPASWGGDGWQKQRQYHLTRECSYRQAPELASDVFLLPSSPPTNTRNHGY